MGLLESKPICVLSLLIALVLHHSSSPILHIPAPHRAPLIEAYLQFIVTFSRHIPLRLHDRPLGAHLNTYAAINAEIPVHIDPS